MTVFFQTRHLALILFLGIGYLLWPVTASAIWTPVEKAPLQPLSALEWNELSHNASSWERTGTIDAPGTNVFLNTSGGVGIGTAFLTPDVLLDVEGKIAAQEYCDENGQNCIAGGSLGVVAGGGLTGIISGGGLVIDGNDVGIIVSGCATGDVLQFDGTDWGCATDTDNGKWTDVVGGIAYNSGNVSISNGVDTKIFLETGSGSDSFFVFSEGGVNKWSFVYDGANTDSLLVYDDENSTIPFLINKSGNIGIGETTPASLFTVGNGDLFQVDSNGNMVKIRNLTYSWPSAHTINGVLTNNGSGTLTWGTLEASNITADSLDFTEFKDTLTLDTSTDIATSGTNVLSITNTGTGNSFVVNDQSTDTTPFVIDASGNVGIGTSSPSGLLGIGDENTYITLDGSNNLSFTDAVTGTKTLAELAAGGGGGITDIVQDTTPQLGGDLDMNSKNVTGANGEYVAVDQIRAYDAAGLKLYDDGGNGLFVEDGGNVGIGTTEPSEKLHIVGSSYPKLVIESDNTEGGELFLQSSTGSYEMYLEGTDLRFFDSTDRVTFQQGGNVGIGTTEPSEKLHIAGSSYPTLVIESDNTEGGDLKLKSSTGSYEMYLAGTDLRFWDSADRVTFQQGGNVGIGTTTPTEKLHLHDGSFRLTPSDPVIVGGVQDATLLNTARSVAIAGSYAYVTSDVDDSLRIIDVSDPTAPVIVGGVQDATDLNSAWGLAVSGSYAYVTAYGDDSLRIIDVSDPTAPVIVGGVKDTSLLDGAQGIAISGSYAYVTSDISLHIIDVSNPTAPVIVGGVQDATDLHGAINVVVSGSYAYVTSEYNDSLRIIDVSDPTAPVIVGGVKDANLDGAWGLAVSGSYAYVTAYEDDSLRIIDVSDPTAPVIVGGVSDASLDDAAAVVVAGSYAYVTTYLDDSLRIIDVSDPTAPVIVGGVKDASLLNGAWGLAVSGSYAYVTAYEDDSLRIIKLDGVEAPTAEIGSLAAGTLRADTLTLDQELSVRGGANIGSDAMIGGTLTVGGSTSKPSLIVESGNIGIGTTTPTEALDVNGNIIASGKIFSVSTIETDVGSTLVTKDYLEAQIPDLSGYLTSFTETDPTVNALAKATLGCAAGEIMKFDGTDWECASDTNTDDQQLNILGNILSLENGGSIDLSGLSTIEVNDLSGTVTWSDVPDANITESSITQHEGALTITESQISDLGSYLSDITGESLADLADVFTGMTPNDGQILTYNTINGWQAEDAESGADNLGDHIATQNIQLGSYYLSGDGNDEGVFVDSNGNVGIGTTSPGAILHIEDSTAIDNEVLEVLRLTADHETNLPQTGFGVGINAYIDQSGSSVLAGQIGFVWDRYLSGDTGIVFKTIEGGAGPLLERMRIDENGYVGIGTDNPRNMLDISENAVIGANYAGTVFAPSNGLLVQGNVGIGIDNTANILRVNGSTPTILERNHSDTNVSRSALDIKRFHSSGAGADGIGVHMGFFVETETEGDDDPVAQVRAIATDATTGTVDSDILLVPYLDGVAVDNAFIVKSDARIGVGTNAPNTDAELHIKTITGDNAEIDIQTGDLDHWAIYQDETEEDLRFWNMGSDNLLTLTNEGRVGIGTSDPSEKLHIAGSSYPKLLIESDNTQGGDLTLKSSTGSYEMYLEGTDLRFWDSTDRVTFKNGGNVGIGTTDPDKALTVAGTFFAGSKDETGVTIDGTEISVYYAPGVNGTDDIPLSLRARGNEDLTLSGGSGGNVIIDSGNVGIGTTTPGGLLGIGDGNTYITLDGSNNLSFTDAITGTKTLAELSGSEGFSNGGDDAAADRTIGNNTAYDLDFETNNISRMTIASSGEVIIPNLQVGSQWFQEDSGTISWINLPVSSVPSAGIVQSYSAQIDDVPLLTIYAEANGTGGIQNQKVKINNIMQLNPTDSPGLCNANNKGTLYFDNSMNSPCFCNGTTWVRFDSSANCT